MELTEKEHAAIIAEFEEWRTAQAYDKDTVTAAQIYIDYRAELLRRRVPISALSINLRAVKERLQAEGLPVIERAVKDRI